ncbi:MAG: KH domain-containing protein [Oscillospiraceae bacterium]|nr:KH domain-containing protein [Oscillospiraceae bacterium]
MKNLLTYIAKSLVENPDAVNVTEVEKEDGLVLELRVAPDDMGKVIGKHGRIAKEIRTVIKAAALKDNIKVSVDILD